MIPLRDDNPTRIVPYVNWALIAINIVVWLLQFFGGTQDSQSGLSGPLAGYAMVPYEVTHGIDIATNGPTAVHPFWLTILTSMFMHGSLLHLGGNMLFLLIFGNNIEDALGHVKYLFFYLLCGFAAAVAQILWNPSSSIPTLGASGAIAGVLGAYVLLYPYAMVDTLVFLFIFASRVRLPAWLLLGFWFVTQFFSQFIGSTAAPGGAERGGVAYLAHIGGFIAGLILIKLFGAKAERPPTGYGYDYSAQEYVPPPTLPPSRYVGPYR